MRVGLVVEQLRRAVPGGIGTYASGLIAGLAAMGPDAPDVTLVASRLRRRPADPPGRRPADPPGRRPAARPDPLAAMGLPLVTSRLPSVLLTRAWDAGLGLPGVDRSLDGRLRPSHTNIQSSPASASGLDLVHAVSLGGPATRGVPSVACVHDLAWKFVPEAFPPRGRRWHEAALARALVRTDRFVVPSEATAEALVAFGAKPGTVVVVEEGCDHLAPVDSPATAALLASLGVSGPYLLCVGTLEPRKNLSRLVQAYARIRPKLPEPWPLVVVGPRGWGPPAFASGSGTSAPSPPGSGVPGVQHTGVPGVLLAGSVSPGVLSGLYAGARCVAYVPLLEGWGLPAVEAMSMGVPVVASPMPSTAGQALEVDPTDLGSIADGLMRAAWDETERAGLIARGRERTGGLTWEATARAHLSVWEEVA